MIFPSQEQREDIADLPQQYLFFPPHWTLMKNPPVCNNLNIGYSTEILQKPILFAKLEINIPNLLNKFLSEAESKHANPCIFQLVPHSGGSLTERVRSAIPDVYM